MLLFYYLINQNENKIIYYKQKYLPNLNALSTTDLTGSFPKNLTSALLIENDPIMRVTARFFAPQDRNSYYYERDSNEMQQTDQAKNELTDNIVGFVKNKIFTNFFNLIFF